MNSKILGLLAVGLLAGGISTQAVALSFTDFTQDVTGIRSFGPAGDPDNELRQLNIGADARVIGIGWDIELLANAPSWLSEMVVRFGRTDLYLLNLTPGIGDDFSGTRSYSSAGVVDLVAIGLDFVVNADGLLRMEFFESFDDFPGDWDGEWTSGALTIRVERTPVPEPGALALLGLGLAGLGLSRRRKAA